ncbi:MAG: hypothetical protein ABSD20_04490 [Terriglobales bacterium]
MSRVLHPSSVKQLFLALLAILFGLGSGYLYFATLDLMILALLVLVIAMAMGAAEPCKPWLWATLLAVSIPAAVLIVRMLGGLVSTGRIEAAFAAGLVSALLGVYAGAMMRRMIAGVFGG